jgi:flagellar basal-body rod modification protein FlgD
MSTPTSLLSATTPVLPTPSSSSSGSSSTALGQDQLNMQDFLKLMTTQLQNQDPMDPTSDSEYFAQIAQLGTVQGIDTLNNSSQVQQAQSLMGQTVVATNTNAAATGGPATISGVVQSLSVQNGNYYLGIQSSNGTISSVPLSALQTVTSTPNISSQSDLVGKTVTGTTTVNGQSSAVTGTVTGVSMVNGIPTAAVQISNNQTVNIGVSGLTSVSD